MSVRVYSARGMSGRPWAEIVAEAKETNKVLELCGIEVLDPVIEEMGDKVPTGVCGDGTMDGDLLTHWERDKQMIRRAHVILDSTPERKSEGVAIELAYGRYMWWMPIVRAYVNGGRPKNSIAYYEHDAIVDTVEEAALYIIRVHGTRLKRFVWRTKMYARSWPKAVWRKLLKWN